MKVLLILCTLITTGCSNGKMEVVPLDIRDSTTVGPPDSSTRIFKSYVVAHPPSIDSLANFALALAKGEQRAYPTQNIWVAHSFYKETDYTPRTFKETTERNGGIDAHGEDLLLDVLHTRSTKMDCWFVNIPRQPKPSPLSHCIYLDSSSKAPVYFKETP